MAKKNIDDYTNKTFGYLTVKEKIIINNRTYWKCECKCGNTKTVYHNDLKQGFIKTCWYGIRFKERRHLGKQRIH